MRVPLAAVCLLVVLGGCAENGPSPADVAADGGTHGESGVLAWTQWSNLTLPAYTVSVRAANVVYTNEPGEVSARFEASDIAALAVDAEWVPRHAAVATMRLIICDPDAARCAPAVEGASPLRVVLDFAALHEWTSESFTVTVYPYDPARPSATAVEQPVSLRIMQCRDPTVCA